MDEKEGISAEEQARRRLRSKQPAGRSLTDHETVSKRLKREATIAAIKHEILKTFTERPDLEQAHKHQNTEAPSRFMHREWWRSTSGEKEELLKGGVDRQRWQQGDKCSMHAGWMNSTRKSHDTWSKTSRTHVIRRCLQQPAIQQWEEWSNSRR